MSSVSPNSMAVQYDSNLPHTKSHLETVIDGLGRKSLEPAKSGAHSVSSSNLPPYARSRSSLSILAHNLPEILTERGQDPFQFSGVVAFQVGNAPAVQACHCPNQVKFKADQPLNVLSVGKLFTAVAVMQLIEDKKLSLETPLSQLLTPEELSPMLRNPYVGENPSQEALAELLKNMDKITIKHILSHTGGLISGDGLPGEIGKYKYSNHGYRLLAQIIGKYTSQGPCLPDQYEVNFRRYIEMSIFKKAGMEGAIAESHKEKSDHPPHCFEISEDGSREKVETEEPYSHGNGCWRMPMSDLLKFSEAVRDHVLIKKESFQTMLNPELPLGFMVDRDQRTGEVTGFGHPGHSPGRSAFLWCWLADSPITAAALSNYNTGDIKPQLHPYFSR